MTEEDEEVPTAAEVSRGGSNRTMMIKSTEYARDKTKDGDELVRRKDHKKALDRQDRVSVHEGYDMAIEEVVELIENKIEEIDSYKIETKFEREAKRIATHKFKEILEELGALDRTIKINGRSLEELLEEIQK